MEASSAACFGKFRRFFTFGTSPSTFFNEGLEYDTNAIYQLPTLRQKCFPSFPTGYINYALARQPMELHERLYECETICFSFFSSLSFASPM